VERYPVLGSGGTVKGFIVSSVEFTVIYDAEQRGWRSYMWITPDYALEVTQFIREGILEVGNVKIEYSRLVEDIPWPLAYVAWNFDGYVNWLASMYSGELAGKTVMVNFSGGKDSAAVLAVMSKLAEKIKNLNVYAVYSHVTFLEPLRNIDVAVKFAERLGAPIEVVEADRELMRRRLLEEGLPYRGRRWCTYMKLRPIKRLRKQRRPHIVADGDRMTEAFKRFYRLYSMSPRKPQIYMGGRIRPIYIWTLLDVVLNVRRFRVVHPDYYMGMPRVACMMCPYKALHEFNDKHLDLLEDPGLIEEAIKVSYRRWYSGAGIPWEDFRRQHLWRHHPVLARKMYDVKRILDRMESLDSIERGMVERMYRSLWTKPLPEAPRIAPEEAVKVIGAVVAEAYQAALERARKATRLVESEKAQRNPATET
jgi:3'-phosphoadenosine 5'-phosphosulfate sulfotransferase (PAPS reductase)/FAD synthetase